jgi:hypothetical protein
MQEEGYDGFDATTWYGLAAPASCRRRSRRRSTRTSTPVLAMPDVQERLDTYGAEDGGGSPEKFAQFHPERDREVGQGRQGRRREDRELIRRCVCAGLFEDRRERTSSRCGRCARRAGFGRVNRWTAVRASRPKKTAFADKPGGGSGATRILHFPRERRASPQRGQGGAAELLAKPPLTPR